MAIKITKRGKDPKERTWQGTCTNCRTSFECLQKDGQYQNGDQREGPFLRVTCPVCAGQAFAYPVHDNIRFSIHGRED